jgi:hypothetical protein
MIRTLILGTAAATALMLAMPSAQAATLAECAGQWRALKDAGKTEGMTYRDFSSKCMKGDSTVAAPAPDATPAEAPATPDKKKKTKVVVDQTDEGDGNNGTGAVKKECDAKWKVEKASSGATGWKAYFTFMAKCM